MPYHPLLHHCLRAPPRSCCQCSHFSNKMMAPREFFPGPTARRPYRRLSVLCQGLETITFVKSLPLTLRSGKHVLQLQGHSMTASMAAQLLTICVRCPAPQALFFGHRTPFRVPRVRLRVMRCSRTSVVGFVL